MRLHLAAVALGLFVVTNDGALAQDTEAPATAPPAEADIKAKIQATQRARDELIQRFEAESAKKGSKDAKRNAQLHSLSDTVCSGCGAAKPIAPVRRIPPRGAVPKRTPAAPQEPPIADDVY